MGLLSSQTIGSVARRKLALTQDLRMELSGKACQVSAIIDEMRAAIKDNTISELNKDGCLIGSEGEYLASFSAQSEHMLSMFDKSQEYWQTRIDKEDAYTKKIAQM